MGQITRIEWCNHTYDPWIGCRWAREATRPPLVKPAQSHFWNGAECDLAHTMRWLAGLQQSRSVNTAS
jgi:hypothetical protein